MDAPTLSYAVAVATLLLVAGCGSGRGSEPAGQSKQAIVNTIVITRDDGSTIAVHGPVSVTCGPANGDGPPALLVRVGQRTPGTPQPLWEIQVGLADLRRQLTFRFPDRDSVGYAAFFVFDVEGGQNELSSSAEEAGGYIAFSKADCRNGVDFRIRAHLGSELFDQPGADVRGRFAAVP